MKALPTSAKPWHEAIALPPVEGVAEAFDAAIEALVQEFRAQEIWVFGSCARGNPTLHSDIDLLVIKDPDPAQRHPASAARELIARRAGFLPCDIIVLPQQTFARRMEHPVGVYSDIHCRGQKLYAR